MHAEKSYIRKVNRLLIFFNIFQNLYSYKREDQNTEGQNKLYDDGGIRFNILNMSMNILYIAYFIYVYLSSSRKRYKSTFEQCAM